MTAGEGRRFGLTVGVAFLAIAGLLAWRGRDVAPLVSGALGGALVLAGLAIPRHLGPVYRAWMKLALLLSRVTTPIFMAVLYFVVMTPMALLRRLFGGNPLRAKTSGGGNWAARPATPPNPSGMTRQF